jgi:hypothetical protein
LSVGLFLLPPIRERVLWHLDEWRTTLFYRLKPPEEAVFHPKGETLTLNPLTIQTTPTTSAPSVTPQGSTKTPQSQASVVTTSPTLTNTPTLTATALPAAVKLEGVRYQSQHGLWNYCAPSNLAMALSFWGWQGDRLDTGHVLKPFDGDANVMPYEMLDYVQGYTDLKAVLRVGGNLDLLKKLIAAGFPVLVEKGVFIKETLTGRLTWMGHYAVLIGYDDAKQVFITRDSYFGPMPSGLEGHSYPEDYPVSYEDLATQWQGFNETFLVIYSSDREEQLMGLLGIWGDEAASYQAALDKATDEINQKQGIELFLAWFNRGAVLKYLQDYTGAAAAFDQAFSIYADLPKEVRPYRVMWYRTEPYFAYYYTGRYQDVVDLATQTIDAAAKPYLEENFYWRALAELALGDQDSAVKDLRTSLEYHPGFTPSVDALQNLGITP